MAYVIAAPEMMASAATDLATIGANVSAANAAAAARTVTVSPAAADEISAAIAAVFANHAQAFQGLAGKVAVVNDQFVHTLKSGGAAYAAAEATSAALLRPVNASAASTGVQGVFADWVNAALGQLGTGNWADIWNKLQVLPIIIIGSAIVLGFLIGGPLIIGLSAPFLTPILDMLDTLFPGLYYL